jgi:hypothetical protein
MAPGFVVAGDVSVLEIRYRLLNASVNRILSPIRYIYKTARKIRVLPRIALYRIKQSEKTRAERINVR